MYADFKGAINAADHRIMFKHTRQLGMPSTFVDTCEQLYGVSSTDYITPIWPHPLHQHKSRDPTGGHSLAGNSIG
jgi:hypothetical protein